jgi:hypothetical protein
VWTEVENKPCVRIWDWEVGSVLPMVTNVLVLAIFIKVSQKEVINKFGDILEVPHKTRFVPENRRKCELSSRTR